MTAPMISSSSGTSRKLNAGIAQTPTMTNSATIVATSSFCGSPVSLSIGENAMTASMAATANGYGTASALRPIVIRSSMGTIVSSRPAGSPSSSSRAQIVAPPTTAAAATKPASTATNDSRSGH